MWTSHAEPSETPEPSPTPTTSPSESPDPSPSSTPSPTETVTTCTEADPCWVQVEPDSLPATLVVGLALVVMLLAAILAAQLKRP